MKIIGGRYRESAELRDLGLTVGDQVAVHETVQLVDIDNIRIGSHVRIDPFSILSANGGHIHIGQNVHIASHVCVFGGGGVAIDDFVGLSSGVKVYSVSDDFSGAAMTGPTLPGTYRKENAAQVALCRHVVVGAGSILLPGVTIGEGTSVGAMSLVRRNLDPWGIYAGNPVKLLKRRKQDLLAMEDAYLYGLANCA